MKFSIMELTHIMEGLDLHAARMKIVEEKVLLALTSDEPKLAEHIKLTLEDQREQCGLVRKDIRNLQAKLTAWIERQSGESIKTTADAAEEKTQELKALQDTGDELESGTLAVEAEIDRLKKNPDELAKAREAQARKDGAPLVLDSCDESERERSPSDSTKIIPKPTTNNPKPKPNIIIDEDTTDEKGKPDASK